MSDFTATPHLDHTDAKELAASRSRAVDSGFEVTIHTVTP